MDAPFPEVTLTLKCTPYQATLLMGLYELLCTPIAEEMNDPSAFTPEALECVLDEITTIAPTLVDVILEREDARPPSSSLLSLADKQRTLDLKLSNAEAYPNPLWNQPLAAIKGSVVASVRALGAFHRGGCKTLADLRDAIIARGIYWTNSGAYIGGNDSINNTGPVYWHQMLSTLEDLGFDWKPYCNNIENYELYVARAKQKERERAAINIIKTDLDL